MTSIISQAKPYSTLIHACCPGEVKGEFLYDPLKSACCPYEDGNILVPVNVYSSFGKGKCPFFTPFIIFFRFKKSII